jgi:hypothetical protein
MNESVPIGAERFLERDVAPELHALGEIAEAQRTGDWSDRGEVSVMASRPAWESDDEEDGEGDDA